MIADSTMRCRICRPDAIVPVQCPGQFVAGMFNVYDAAVAA